MRDSTVILAVRRDSVVAVQAREIRFPEPSSNGASGRGSCHRGRVGAPIGAPFGALIGVWIEGLAGAFHESVNVFGAPSAYEHHFGRAASIGAASGGLIGLLIGLESRGEAPPLSLEDLRARAPRRQGPGR